MKNILDIPVSLFANYGTIVPKRDISLYNWLQYCTSDKAASLITHLRKIEDKTERDKLKAKLPCITVSGVFTPDRRQNNLQQHSGFIAIDIDAKENSHFGNLEDVKREINRIPFVAYCGLSASGRGLFVIIPIAYPEKHKEHFGQLLQDFRDCNINIDKACPNLDRLRGLSYDPAAFFNENAEVYPYLFVEPKASIKYKRYSSSFNNNDDIEWFISELQKRDIDITNGYGDWLRIGFALVNEYGEGGRHYYHAISEISPKYKQAETDNKFTNCLRTNNGSITIATFYALCKQNGITRPKKNNVLFQLHKLHTLHKEPLYPPEWDTWETEPVSDTNKYYINLNKQANGILKTFTKANI